MLFCAILPGQDALQQFNRGFVAAVRGAEQPGADFADLHDRLLALEDLIPELPAERRGAARFGLGVRRAEMRMRGGALAAAGEIGLLARERARDEEAYQGSSRAILLTILWQCLPAEDFRALLDEDDDPDFLAPGGTAEQRAPYLQPAIALLRADLLLQTDELRGLAALRALAAQFVAERPREDQWRVKCLATLAWAYLVRRDLARAELWLAELPDGIARYPRARIALRRGDRALALELGRELAKENPRYQQLLGDALEAAEDLEAAETAYQAAEAAARTPLDRMLALRGQGDCARLREDHDRAESLYRRALAEGEDSLHAAAERAGIQAARGHAAAAMGDHEHAWTCYQAALEGLDAARAELATDVFGGHWSDADALEAVSGMLGLPFRFLRGRSSEVLAAMELGKARTLLDLQANASPASDAVGLRDAVQALATLDDPRQLEASRRDLEAVRAPTGRATGRPLSADELSSLTGEMKNTTVLSYWLGAEDCFVWWQSRGDDFSTSGVRRLGAADEAVRLAAAAHDAVRRPTGDPNPALDAAAEFFLPRIAFLRRGWTVVISPGFGLGQVPFEALPNRRPRMPLGLLCFVERAASLTSWAQLRERQAAEGGVAVLHSAATDPELDALLQLDPLEWSGEEGAAVRAAYDEGAVVAGSEATLSGLQDLLAQGPFDAVHLSAHAVQNAYVPSASLLVLADGPASLGSLLSLPCDGATVVLSACSSARGEGRRGDGELGLLLWPLARGARAVVASTWPVNQQATADLMRQFHAARAEGLDDGTALRAARRILAASPQYAHPHYWSGFALYAAEPHLPLGATLWPFFALAAVLALLGLVVHRRSGA